MSLFQSSLAPEPLWREKLDRRDVLGGTALIPGAAVFVVVSVVENRQQLPVTGRARFPAGGQ